MAALAGRLVSTDAGGHGGLGGAGADGPVDGHRAAGGAAGEADALDLQGVVAVGLEGDDVADVLGRVGRVAGAAEGGGVLLAAVGSRRACRRPRPGPGSRCWTPWPGRPWPGSCSGWPGTARPSRPPPGPGGRGRPAGPGRRRRLGQAGARGSLLVGCSFVAVSAGTGDRASGRIKETGEAAEP